MISNFMFFSISNKKDSNFPNHIKLGKLFINLDNGWKTSKIGNNQVLYKGYADDFELSLGLSAVIDTKLPIIKGNFCVIVFDNDKITIKSSKDRSFPIYHLPNKITNLEKLPNAIWSDKVVVIDQNLKITENIFDAIGNIDSTELPEEEVIDKLDLILTQKTKNFILHNKLPIKAFLSGGIDSMLVYSYIKQATDNFDLVAENIIEFDEFWCKNSQKIKQQYWAYNQIHHWRNDCILTTGAPGDEFMLRSPTTANMYLMHHNDTILDHLNTKSLHQNYFSLDKHKKLFYEQNKNIELLELIKNKDKLYHQMVNIILNDWQHWHLGNTLTFTPLRDIEIFKLFLRLPVKSAYGQIFNSEISKKLIARNDKKLLKFLSKSKNNEQFSNLWNYYKSMKSATSGQ